MRVEAPSNQQRPNRSRKIPAACHGNASLVREEARKRTTHQQANDLKRTERGKRLMKSPGDATFPPCGLNIGAQTTFYITFACSVLRKWKYC